MKQLDKIKQSLDGVKAGDKLWCARVGLVVVAAVDMVQAYPIKLTNGMTFTMEGKYAGTDYAQSLFLGAPIVSHFEISASNVKYLNLYSDGSTSMAQSLEEAEHNARLDIKSAAVNGEAIHLVETRKIEWRSRLNVDC